MNYCHIVHNVKFSIQSYYHWLHNKLCSLTEFPPSNLPIIDLFLTVFKLLNISRFFQADGHPVLSDNLELIVSHL